jgi:subtilisin family serine protease
MKYRVKINSVDVTVKLLEEGFHIDGQEGGIMDTAACSFYDSDNSLSIVAGNEIIIENFDDATERQFGGLINQVTVEHDGLVRLISVAAQDWKMILSKASFAKIYNNLSDYDIIQDSFTEAGITEFDTTTFVVGVTTGRVIPRLVAKGMTLRQMLDILISITGYVWDVDAFKRLHYHSEFSSLAPFNFSTAYDGVSTFGYSEAKRVTTMGEYNTVEIRGGVKLVQVTDIYSGDGARVFFNLRIDGIVAGREYHNIFRGPVGADPDVPIIEKNIGSDGVPDWDLQSVGIESIDTLTAVDVLWSALAGYVEFANAPPNFANNSWRITGQYAAQAAHTQPDDVAIAAAGGRIFKKVLTIPEIETDQQAIDIAQAFLRAQGPKDRILLSYDRDGLEVCDAVNVADTLFGVDKLYQVHRLSSSILGGSTINYNATLGNGPVNGGELAEIMRELADKAGRQGIPLLDTLTVIREASVAVEVGPLEITTVGRGPNYFCISPNLLLNPYFDSDLTSWTELIQSGIAGTTEHVSAQGFTFTQQGSIGGLKIAMTDGDTANNSVGRYQDIAALPGQVWNLEVHALVPALSSGARVDLRREFLDAGLAVLSFSQVSIVATNSAFTRMVRENQIAPANTVWIRVWLRVRVGTGTNQTGTVYFGRIRAMKGPTTIRAWADRIIAGAWVCRA